MGIQLSKPTFKFITNSHRMAESTNSFLCQCASNPTSSTSSCQYCQPSTSLMSESSAETTSTSQGTCSNQEAGQKRTFRNLSLGCCKSSRSKEKTADKSSKSKLNWTFKWRLKSSGMTEPTTREPVIDLNRFNPADFPIEDKDEVARRKRAREMAEGIEIEQPVSSVSEACYVESSDSSSSSSSSSGRQLRVEAEIASPAEAASSHQLPEEAAMAIALQPNLSASIIEGLTVLLHRSLAISIDSQRAWNVLTHGDLHFLVQHFHWHQHQHGPEVNIYFLFEYLFNDFIF